MSGALRFVVKNWPLKLAALVLATLLYAGLVLSQAAREYTGSVAIETTNQAGDVIVLSDLGAVRSIRYVAPESLGLRVDSTTFRATVDLAGVDPTGASVSLAVHVAAVDSSVQVQDYEPRTISVTLDRVTSRTVAIVAQIGEVPAAFTVGTPVLGATTAVVRGPSTVVAKVAQAVARVPVDASGIDVDRDIALVPVDAGGEFLSPLDLEPATVHVRLAVFTDRRTRALPVNPVVAGTPAAGFEVASVTVSPLVVSVEGDANDLSSLDAADTAPISISGASSDVVTTASLDLPAGVQALGSGTVSVTIAIRPVTATRTFEAGIVLVGARADREYALSTDRVLITIGGSVADLDRLSGSGLTVTVDVTGLDLGAHDVHVTTNLTTGLTLLGASPDPIVVTVTAPAPSPT